MDRILKDLWAQVLDVQQGHLEDDDNFFEIGGNSINALRLVDAAEHLGYSLNVPDIYRHPELRQMSEIFGPRLADKPEHTDPAPFELLQGTTDIEKCLSELRTSLSVTDKESIEDIYPCTPLQEGLMAVSMKHQGSYKPQFVFRLPHTLDIALLKDAWGKVLAQSDALRTRIVRLDGSSGLFQVVVTDSMEWESGDNLDAYLAADRERPMGLGDPLVRLAIIHQSMEDQYLVWTIHHAIHDRWSIAMIQDQIAATYGGMTPPDPTPPRFSGFMRHVINSSNQEQKAFWEKQLGGSRPLHFPNLPTPDYQPATTGVFEYSASVPQRHSSSVTISTIIQSAWALTVSRHSDSDDIVFGMTLIGRDTPVTGVTRMHGPTVATVPVAMHLDYDNTIQSFLTDVQTQMNDLITFQHFGTQNISALNSESRTACKFQNLLVIQPAEEDSNALGWEKVKVRMPDVFDYGIVIECEFTPDQRVLKIRVHHDPAMISTTEVEALVHHFEQAIFQFSQESPSLRVGQVSLFGSYDRGKIAEWNGERSQEQAERCIHAAFQQIAGQCPRSTAIDSWDGSLTYSQLDQLSTGIAYHLMKEYGIRQEDLVPVCLEKSLWMPVAILGVLKAGGAFVPLDPSHPKTRLRHIVEDSRAKVVLTSSKYQDLFTSTMTVTFCLGHDQPAQLPTEIPPGCSITATPQGAAYVIFTSGSTGTPKGVVIEHRSFITSALAYGKAIAINETSRVLQFSSYSFDCCLAEILTTLLLGGCVCIPSDYDRLHNLSATMNHMRINTAFLTPSASRLLTPVTLTCLKTLIFVGEQLLPADLMRWSGRGLLIMNGYGPTECAVISTINTNVRNQQDTSNIGSAVGCKTWVVDEHEMNCLTPVGCSGELLIDGRTLARGYLDNPALTASVFVDLADFSQLNGDNREICTRRVYRTGDIVRRLPDGSIRFVRRKDGQLKIRGNRLEATEVEHNIKLYLGDRAHVNVFKHSYQIAEGGSELSVEFLAAIICNPDGKGLCRADVSTTSVRTEDVVLSELVPLKSFLEDTLPTYMVPTVYVPFKEVPLTTSGKLDRAFLRRALSLMSRQQISQLSLSTTKVKMAPSTIMEANLCKWWSEVLKLPLDAIGVDDNFFQLGGDSILAVHLSSIARDAGIKLDVPTIFSAPKLSQMAEKVNRFSGTEEKTTQPFALLENYRDSIIKEATDQLQVPPDAISDIYPCTPLQEALISLSAQRPGAAVLRTTFHLPQGTDLEKVRAAWAATIAANPILRTRIIQTSLGEACQVVMNTGPEVEVCQDETYCVDGNGLQPPHCGGHLLKLTLVKKERDARLVMQIHHAAYDGWSLRMIIQQAQAAFRGETILQPPPFSHLVAYTQQVDFPAMKRYWETQAAGFQGVTFPPLPARRSSSKATRTLQHKISKVHSLPGGFTLSNVIRLAWALTIAQYTGSDDVAFGITLAGRSVPVNGIEKITGPTITTVPLRINLNFDRTVLETLEKTHHQSVEMIPFEQIGLQKISGFGPETERLCRFNNLLVVQPKKPTGHIEQFAGTEMIMNDLGPVTSCSLTIMCEPQGDSIEINAIYDVDIMWKEDVQQTLLHFSHMLTQLTRHPQAFLKDIPSLSPEDTKQLRHWNQRDLSPVDECVHEIVRRRSDLQPPRPAVIGWDGCFTYAEVDRISSLLAAHLVHMGVRPQTFVPLCLERSKWTPISVLAVLKAGAAFVLLDTTFPESRLHDICQTVDASIVIHSACHAGLAQRLCGVNIVIDGHNATWPHTSDMTGLPSDCQPDHAAYAVFTSGTTGKPKGIIIEHRSFASSIALSAPALGLQKGSRVLHFSSYAFDVSILEILSPLMTGGCICIPSELDRRSDLAGAINAFDCNWAMLTPSVTRVIDPKTVPCLRTLCLIGEKPTSTDVCLWKDNVRLMNTYGPAECSVVSTVNTCFDNPDDPANIGQPTGARHWIVDQNRHDRLVPLGTVGELLLEGPIVGRGYIGDGRNPNPSTAFIAPPSWMKQVRPGSSHTRCYKTGDLAWMASDGSIHFVGRKDRQAKLHGQRLELGEVEHHVQLCFDGALQVVAEIIKPLEHERPPLLVAFIYGYPSLCQDHGLILPATQEFREASSAARSRLRNILPSFMVPTVFLPMSTVPLGKTGKLDRQTLREKAASRAWGDLTADVSRTSESHMPSTAMERQLRDLWGAALGLGVEAIGVDDDFFHLGDSLSAMRLASSARSHGLMLTVPDIFEYKTIRKLVSVIEHRTPSELVKPAQPFSLMDAEFKLDELIPSLAASGDVVVDVLPLTWMQLRLLKSFSLAELFYSLHGKVDLDRLRNACDAVMERHSILRTVFCHYHDTVVQAILKTNTCAFEHIVTEKDLQSFLATYSDSEVHEPPVSGKPLVKFTLISGSGLEHVFIIRLCHAQYDENSLLMILGEIATLYNEHPESTSPAPVAFSDYIYFQSRQRLQDMMRFWTGYLQGFSGTRHRWQDEASTTSPVPTTASLAIELDNTETDMPHAFIVAAAFSAILQSMTGEDDLVYGLVTSTRDIALPGADGIVGPCLAVTPIHVPLKATGATSVCQLVRLVQEQYLKVVRLGGNLDILEITDDIPGWNRGRDIMFLLNHTPANSERNAFSLNGVTTARHSEKLDVQTGDRVAVTSAIDGGSLKLQVRSSSAIMQEEDADILAAKLAHTVNRFLRSPDAAFASLVD